jgi:hypothetical protein
MISIKGHEYHSAQSSYQLHDLTYRSFCKTHVSHGNKALSSIAKTNSWGLDAFNLPLLVIDDNTKIQKIRVEVFEHAWFT